ncbi:MAG: lysylphosphatidylglycerol synthase transmembrane domain-containing protein [Dehalococcoidia bacterium]
MSETASPVAQEPISLRKRFFSPQTAISLVAVVGLVALLVTGVDIDWAQTWETVRGMDPAWYAAAIAIHYCTFVFRGARWRVLLVNAARNDPTPPPAPPVFYVARVILMSWFANSITWFRLGDPYRAWVYAEDTKTSFPRSMGTVLADRLIDLAVVVVLMSAGILLLLADGRVRPPLVLLLLAGGLLAAVMAGLTTMVLARRWLVPRLPRRLSTMYARFHDGTMGSFARMPLVFGLGVLGWLCEAGRLYFVTMAIGVPVAAGLVLFVPMANGLLAAIPLTPGGLGVVETGVSGLLRLQLTVEVALAVALVDRTISYLSIIVTGGIAFAARQVNAARRAAHVPETPAEDGA